MRAAFVGIEERVDTILLAIEGKDTTYRSWLKEVALKIIKSQKQNTKISHHSKNEQIIWLKSVHFKKTVERV
jgi:hypothetical protein